jgi:hypothetical protein
LGAPKASHSATQKSASGGGPGGVRSHCHHDIAFFVMPITAAGQQAVKNGPMGFR